MHKIFRVQFEVITLKSLQTTDKTLPLNYIGVLVATVGN